MAASTCEAFSARRWKSSTRALSRPAIAWSVMVWAARSKVSAVFKYSLFLCEIWAVIVPSRGSLAPGLRRFGASPANCSHLPDELLSDRRTSRSKGGGSPRVVPDDTKPAITNCASRGCARSKACGAVGHCYLLLRLSSPFVDHPFLASHFREIGWSPVAGSITTPGRFPRTIGYRRGIIHAETVCQTLSPSLR